MKPALARSAPGPAGVAWGVGATTTRARLACTIGLLSRNGIVMTFGHKLASGVPRPERKHSAGLTESFKVYRYAGGTAPSASSPGTPVIAKEVAVNSSGSSDSITLDAAQILASVGEVAYDWHIGSDVLLWSGNVGDVLLIRDVAGDRDRPRLCAVPRGRERAGRASTPSCNRTSATTATASPIRSNTASAPIPAPRRGCGSRTPAAGSPAPTAGRRARTASCASSTSATSTSAG